MKRTFSSRGCGGRVATALCAALAAASALAEPKIKAMAEGGALWQRQGEGAIIRDMKKDTDEIVVLGNVLRLSECELLHSFDTFDPADWTIVKHTPKWTVSPDRVVGGGPDEPHHGQVFYKTPVKGDVVLAFDARIIPPSYHDLVWFWNTRFDAEPWSGGYLGCLGGWYADMAGIEKLPDYKPSAIAPSFPTEPGRTYRIVSGSIGSEHFIAVDGKLVTYFADADVPDPSKPGYFGFGIFESHAEYSHLRVYRPRPRQRPLVYVPGTQRP